MMKLVGRIILKMIVKSIINAEGRENIRKSIRTEGTAIWLEDCRCESYVNDGMHKVLGFDSHDIESELIKRTI
jgi:hypothetical protein